MTYATQILIIEAERFVATYLKEQLGAAGYGVLGVAKTVKVALDMIAETAVATRPDVVLLDRALEREMDEVTVAEQIQTCFDVPVIYVSPCSGEKVLSFRVPLRDVMSPLVVQDLHSAIEIALYKQEMDRKLRTSEAALRESERQFRIVADFTYDWEYWIDPDGKLLYVSPSCTRITGYSPQAFMQNPALLKAILHPDNEEDIVRRFEASLENPVTYSADLRIVARDKKDRWIGYVCQPIYDAEGGWLGQRISNRDITERRQMEAALRRERDFAESLIDTAQTIVLVLDKQGCILRFNPYMEEISGYRLAEVQAQDWFSTFLPEEDRDEIRALFLQAVNDVQTRGNVNPIVTKDGMRRDIEWYDKTLKDMDGNLIGLLAVGQDVTARKHMQMDLHRYAARLEIQHEIDQAILAAQSPEAIAEVVLEHLRRLLPCRMMGVVENPLRDQKGSRKRAEPARVLAMWVANPVDIVGLESFPSAAAEFEQLKLGQVSVVDDLSKLPDRLPMEQLLYEQGMGSYVHLPLMAKGEFIGSLDMVAEQPAFFTAEYIAIATEVAASLAVALQQARLHEQTRYDAIAKAELLREVNHRVGNNLMAIIGLLLTERRYLSATNRPFVEPMLERLIGRVSGLAEVHNMLAKSNWAPVCLRDLTERIIRFALSALPSGKQINFAVTSSRPSTSSPITVSPRQANHLALVVNELAMNTVKHAMQGRTRGNITVSIEDEEDTMIKLEYRDDGPGYPEETLDFKAYEVGLYLVRRFVTTTLHGTLELKNDNGAVATLRFAVEEKDRT